MDDKSFFITWKIAADMLHAGWLDARREDTWDVEGIDRWATSILEAGPDDSIVDPYIREWMFLTPEEKLEAFDNVIQELRECLGLLPKAMHVGPFLEA